MKKNANIAFLISMLLFVNSPGIKAQNDTPPEPDYNKSEDWVSLPVETKNHPVDVFYVYPTILFGTEPQNMDIQNPELRGKAVGVMKEQASIFSGTANIFAPYYRQVSIPVLNLSDEEADKYKKIGYQDVQNAFLYYMENLNQGRPFILAGHSQGSMMLIQLMKDHFNNAELTKKLIAAYLIGYSITGNDLIQFPWLRIAQSDDDLGVIITYNTQSPDAKGSPVLLPGASCVNPLSWTNSNEYASENLNLGAVFFDENHDILKTEKEYTDAQIGESGALIVTKPNPDDYYDPDHAVFPKGVFHAYDYNFFFTNLAENAKLRVKKYLETR